MTPRPLFGEPRCGRVAPARTTGRRLWAMRRHGRSGAGTRGPMRDRRGRGLRGELTPRAVPRSRTRGEQFDDLVLDAVEELEVRWGDELAGVEFAIEEVPVLTHGAQPDFDPDVIADRGVPLGR